MAPIPSRCGAQSRQTIRHRPSRRRAESSFYSGISEAVCAATGIVARRRSLPITLRDSSAPSLPRTTRCKRLPPPISETAVSNVRLGDYLIREGKLRPEQLERALETQKLVGGRLGTNLLELGLVSEDQLLKALGQLRATQTVSNSDLRGVQPEVIRMIPAKLAMRYKLVPYLLKGKTIFIAAKDPGDPLQEDEIGFLTSCMVRTCIATELRVEIALRRFYRVNVDHRFLILGKRLAGAARSAQAAAESTSASAQHAASDRPAPPPAVIGTGSFARQDPEPAPAPAQTPRPAVTSPSPASAPGSKEPPAPKPPASQLAASKPGVRAGRPRVHRTRRRRPGAAAPSRPADDTGTGTRPGARRVSSRPGACQSTAEPTAAEHAASDEAAEAEAWLEAVPRGGSHCRRRSGRRGAPNARLDGAPGGRDPRRDRRRSAALRRRLLHSAHAADLPPRPHLRLDGRRRGRAPSAVAAIDLEAQKPSVFAGLKEASSFWLGPLPPLPSNQVLSQALGGAPQDCLVLPVTLRSKVVCYLYVDNGVTVASPERPWPR